MKQSNNCYIFETDAFTTRVYDRNETIDMFGQDYLDEYGHCVPEELLSQYEKAYAEFLSIQNKIKFFERKG